MTHLLREHLSMDDYCCGYCRKMGIGVGKACGGCLCIFYCSKQCQINHWLSDHEKWCQSIQRSIKCSTMNGRMVGVETQGGNVTGDEETAREILKDIPIGEREKYIPGVMLMLHPENMKRMVLGQQQGGGGGKDDLANTMRKTRMESIKKAISTRVPFFLDEHPFITRNQLGQKKRTVPFVLTEHGLEQENTPGMSPFVWDARYRWIMFPDIGMHLLGVGNKKVEMVVEDQFGMMHKKMFGDARIECALDGLVVLSVPYGYNNQRDVYVVRKEPYSITQWNPNDDDGLNGSVQSIVSGNRCVGLFPYDERNEVHIYMVNNDVIATKRSVTVSMPG
jgi:hypothetical protein